ncbi:MULTISPECIES: response regulator transcription factor [Mycobacteriales]|uniref:Transcriptional regulatory protein n=1 Tax=Microbacterium sp. MA1 TaxID=614068 RepID=C3UMX4_9MICO|nr:MULTISPECIES: response regulator transcription factor [Mycobacteriales]ACO88865.1 transcriptional regulatory protein [Microbacterium sp. MA1]ART90636.1 transcriptional regulatory protein [Rhodococcus rhodochrous]OOL33123.1 Transcriptional regulatory protein [Rhodococcus rhodochrous]
MTSLGPTDAGTEQIRVLLVDDQELIRTGLRRILRVRDGFDIVGECADGSEVLAGIAEHRPDIVVMDLRMRNIDGITATTMVQSLREPPPVLVLTTFDDDVLLSRVLRAGAAGFILKDSPAEALIWAVRAVVRDGAFLDPAVTERVLQGFRRAGREQVPVAPELTDRESDVLRLIARGQTNTEIASTLGISSVTVKSHVNHIFTKLDLRDRAAAIVYAFDHGLVVAEYD